jgi:hypothetical protein
VLKDFKRKMPGFYGDTGKYNYGQINFREMVEGLYNEPAGPPSRGFEPATGLSDFIDFKGSLALGSGRMGIDRNATGILAEGDTWVEMKRVRPWQNIINLSSKNIGHELTLDMPELYFSQAGFTAGKTQAGKERIGKTGEISLEQLSIKVKGLASYTLTISVELKGGTIQDVQIGDITFTDASELAKLDAPSLTDVDPKGVPKDEPQQP